MSVVYASAGRAAEKAPASEGDAGLFAAQGELKPGATRRRYNTMLVEWLLLAGAHPTSYNELFALAARMRVCGRWREDAVVS